MASSALPWEEAAAAKTAPLPWEEAQSAGVQYNPTLQQKVEDKLPGTNDTGLKGAVHHLQDTLDYFKPTYHLTAPSMASEIYKKLTGQPNELNQIPKDIVTQGIPMIMGAPEGETPAARVVPQPEAEAEGASSMLSRAAEVAKRRITHLPGVQALRDAGYILAGADEPKIPTAPPAPQVPEMWGKGQYGTPVDQWGQRATVYPGAPLPENPGTFPGAPYPEHPGVFPGASEPSATAEQLNPALVSAARSLPGQIAPEVVSPNGPIPGVNARPSLDRIAPPRQGLMLTGNVEQPVVAQPAPSPMPQPIKPTILQQQIEQGLGNQPMNLKPNVPLREQIPSLQPKTEPLIEGHTAVSESKALRSYKYDPATQTFEAHFKGGGAPVRYGGISPEQAQYFEEATSKGKAMQSIKNSGTVVAKYINGKWEPIKTASASAAND